MKRNVYNKTLTHYARTKQVLRKQLKSRICEQKKISHTKGGPNKKTSVTFIILFFITTEYYFNYIFKSVPLPTAIRLNKRIA